MEGAASKRPGTPSGIRLHQGLLGRILIRVSVSVRRVFESYEPVVIQEWWPDSRRVTDVDEQEPRALRPQQVAIPERFDRRRMEAGRTFDPTWQARRRQAAGDHACGGERAHVRSLNRLSVARDPERPATEKHDLRLFRSVDLWRHIGTDPPRAL